MQYDNIWKFWKIDKISKFPEALTKNPHWKSTFKYWAHFFAYTLMLKCRISEYFEITFQNIWYNFLLQTFWIFLKNLEECYNIMMLYSHYISWNTLQNATRLYLEVLRSRRNLEISQGIGKNSHWKSTFKYWAHFLYGLMLKYFGILWKSRKCY